jgi:hypothetical protein
MSWTWEPFYLKSRLFLERANAFEHSKDEFPFWSALGLELLARAALIKVQPTLNADPRDHLNLLYALGYKVTATPKSVELKAVLARLQFVVPGFGKTQSEVCENLAIRRNEELHGGELSFALLKESEWLPRYYQAAEVLCVFLGKDLADWLGSNVGASARKLIDSLKAKTLKQTKEKVSAHAKRFREKPKDERAALTELAKKKALFLFPGSAAVECPSCKSKALLKGELIKELEPRYEEDNYLSVDQEFLATSLGCPACDLELKSLEEVLGAGLQPRFSSQSVVSLHERFLDEVGDVYENM